MKQSLLNLLLALAAPALLAAVLMHGLHRVAIPQMMESGNRELVRSVARAMTRHHADLRRWPVGSNQAIWCQLKGIDPAELLKAGFSLDPDQPLHEATGKDVTEWKLIAPYYFRREIERTVNGMLCDAWETPLSIRSTPDGPAVITSAGPDRTFGTADDYMEKVPLQPAAIGPFPGEQPPASASQK